MDAGGFVDLGIPGLSWIERIGAGGFGEVHRAHDEAHGRDVALKLLHSSSDERSRARFNRERRLMGKVSNHPNVVTIFTSGFNERNVPFIVMELIDGGTIADRIAQAPMGLDAVKRLGLRLADALASAHEAGILHLDVKPANVLIGRDGEPLLADFGIASTLSEIAMRETIAISPAYSPPELLDNRAVDVRSDIYSLAVTLYECLTGRPPYDGDGIIEVARRMSTGEVPRISDPTVPPALIDLLAESMAMDPSARPSTMREFATRLDAIERSSSPEGPAASASSATLVSPPAGSLPESPATATPSAAQQPVAPQTAVPVGSAQAGGVVPPPAPAPPAFVSPPGPAGGVPAGFAEIPSADTGPNKLPLLLGGVIVAAIVALIAVFALGRGGDTEVSTGDDPQPASNPAATPTAAPPEEEPTPTPAPTATPAPTPTPVPTVTPVPSPTPVIERRSLETQSAPLVSADDFFRNNFSNAVWSSGVADNGAGFDSVGIFEGVIPAGTPQVCVRIELLESVTGTLTFAWKFPSDPTYNISEDLTFDVFDNLWFGCRSAQDVCGTCTLPSGALEFRLSQADRPLATLQRHIGDFRLETIRIENQSNEPFCEVNLSDVNADYWGPNLLGQVVFPGEFVDLLWPGSRIDVRAIGCNTTEPLIEQTTVDLFSTTTVGLG